MRANLLLGAWRCGMFRTDPVMVADVFDRTKRVRAAFADRFSA